MSRDKDQGEDAPSGQQALWAAHLLQGQGSAPGTCLCPFCPEQIRKSLASTLGGVMGGLGLAALSQRDQNGGEDSPFGVTPCQSRAGDTKGHPLGQLDPKPQSRDLGPQVVAVGSRGGVSTNQAGPRPGRAQGHSCASLGSQA